MHCFGQLEIDLCTALESHVLPLFLIYRRWMEAGPQTFKVDWIRWTCIYLFSPMVAFVLLWVFQHCSLFPGDCSLVLYGGRHNQGTFTSCSGVPSCFLTVGNASGSRASLGWGSPCIFMSGVSQGSFLIVPCCASSNGCNTLLLRSILSPVGVLLENRP